METMEAINFVLLVSVAIFCVFLIVAYIRLKKRAARKVADLSQTNLNLWREKAEQERREAAVFAKKEWYRLLFNNTRDMVFVYEVTDNGLPGKFVEMNEMACRKLGYTREKLLAMTPLDIELSRAAGPVPGYTRAELVVSSDGEVRRRTDRFAARDVQQLMKQIMENEEVVMERVYEGRRGEKIPVEVTAHRFDLEGKPMILSTATDITEWHEAERALHESEQRFRGFFTHSPIGVAVYDARRDLADANQACLKMFGVPEMREFARFNVFDNPYIPPAARKSLNTGQQVRYEAEIDFDEVRRLGLFVTGRKGTAYLDILVTNMGRDAEYNPKGYLAQVQDITERRLAEEALSESERQLRQAQKMEAIGTLAGGIAHDFNNILTPILGYSELLRNMIREDGRVKDYIAEILGASHRAKDLVDQILTFSHRTEHKGKPIRISPIVKEVLKLLRGSVPENIEIRRIIKTEHDTVIASPTPIHQVLMNLCTNAIHAMRKKGGILEVRMTDFVVEDRPRQEFLDLQPGRYLRLSVKDTGSGMDQQTMDRIFEPFFTTKRKGEGTGMGLAVVHGIVTGFKGTITVESEEGAGSTFHVILPTVERPAETGMDEPGSAFPGGNETVLFVDDEPSIVKMQSSMLAALGYQAVVTDQSAEALQMFQRNPQRFDIVISDQTMPGMTGIELAQKMLSIRPDLPFILCTGFSEDVSVKTAEAIGVREFVMKPIAMRNLAEAIRRALDVKPAAGERETV